MPVVAVVALKFQCWGELPSINVESMNLRYGGDLHCVPAIDTDYREMRVRVYSTMQDFAFYLRSLLTRFADEI